MVRDEHLVAVELDLVLVDGHALLDLREVEHAGQREGVVHVEVDPEHRLLLHRIELLIELEVVLVLELGRGLGPDRVDVVDDVVLVGLDALAVLPLGLLAEDHRDGHELAVLAQQLGDAPLGGELLGVVVQVEGDLGAAVLFLAGAHGVLRGAVAGPGHGLGAFLPAEGVDGDLLAHHEGGVEAQAEVADDGAELVFVFLEELAGGGEGDLVDVAVDFLLGHADAAVDDLEGFLLLVELHADFQLAQLALEVAAGGEGLHLLGGVHRVRDELAEEDFVVGIEELLDHREDVLGGHADFAFKRFGCHICTYLDSKKGRPWRPTLSESNAVPVTICHIIYRGSA